MAVIKIINIKSNLDKVINYVKNDKKTNDGILVDSVNCLIKTAYKEMSKVKKSFNKETGTLAYHIIQSFDGYEVTPQTANEIGTLLAEEMFGDKYQVLICTHINRKNVHNHIVVNSVSFMDGLKYHNSNTQIALLKDTSDRICSAYNLSTIVTEKTVTEKYIREKRLDNYFRSDEKMQQIKSDIDFAISNSNSYKEYKNILNAKGYFIKDKRKYNTITSPYFSRSIRLERAFGEDYSAFNIQCKIQRNKNLKRQQRIFQYNEPKRIKSYKCSKGYLNKYKKNTFINWYMAFLYLLDLLLPQKKIIHNERSKKSPEYYKVIKIMDEFSEENRTIGRLQLKNINELKDYIKTSKITLLNLKSEREVLWRKYNSISNEENKEILLKQINENKFKSSLLDKDIKVIYRAIKRAENGIADLKENIKIFRESSKHTIENIYTK